MLRWKPTTCFKASFSPPAAILGGDLGTVEGVLAAQAYAQALVLAENGLLSGPSERGERARVITEAIGLYEMYRSDLFTLPNKDALDAVNLARRLAADARAARDAGRLVIDEGPLSQGWIEVFPRLPEDQRRLGQLSSFTPERIEQWLETQPAEGLGLPIPADPARGGAECFPDARWCGFYGCGRQGATILFGANCDWVLVNDETGTVIHVNGKHNRRQEPPW